MSDGFEVFNLGELAKDLERLVLEMPDAIALAQMTVAKNFKKRVVQKTPKSSNKRKRKLKSSYKIRKEGWLDEQMVLFNSEARHFHLVERGHKVVPRKPGTTEARKTTTKTTGKDSVVGKFMVAKSITEFTPIYDQVLNKAIDKAIKKVK